MCNICCFSDLTEKKIMEEIKKKLKEWGSICRISNIKKDPLTFSYSDMLSFAKYYHESQAKNNESLHLVRCRCDCKELKPRKNLSEPYKCAECGKQVYDN